MQFVLMLKDRVLFALLQTLPSLMLYADVSITYCFATNDPKTQCLKPSAIGFAHASMGWPGGLKWDGIPLLIGHVTSVG